MKQRLPGLFRVVQIDYWALISLLAPAVTWVIYAADILFDLMPDGIPILFGFCVVATLIGLPSLLWRFLLIRRVLETGQETSGVITLIWFYRDRGRVEYTYRVEGQPIMASHALHKTARTRQLYQGQEVTLVVDPQNVKRAFIRELFLDE